MNGIATPITLALRLALLSSISFGGFASVLPDVCHFVVVTHEWMTERDFTNFFALAQAIPGPNMILMMSFIGWRVWGIPGAIASAVATLGPPCVLYFLAYRAWDCFRGASWQGFVRLTMVPVTAGLVIAGGIVMERAGDTDMPAALITLATVALTLRMSINPIIMLLAGAVLGGLGFL
jgi:chromate transporter